MVFLNYKSRDHSLNFVPIPRYCHLVRYCQENWSLSLGISDIMCHEEEQGVQNPINSQAVFHRALNSQEMQIGLIWKSLGNAGLKETSLAGFFFFFFFFSETNLQHVNAGWIRQRALEYAAFPLPHPSGAAFSKKIPVNIRRPLVLGRKQSRQS